jgi:methionyl aminopeptidase
VIVCKSAAELDRMRAPNRLVAEVLQALEETVAPGVTTEDLDVLAERMVRDGGAVPAFKGYRGFPATLCASVNEEVVHGIPSSKRPLRDGDIISPERRSPGPT